MRKLNQTIHRKLIAQAEEAKSRGMVKLAQDIVEALEETGETDQSEEYSYAQLKEDVRSDLWKSAAKLIGHYNINSVDAEKVQRTIEVLTAGVINELETTLNVDPADPGSLDPKVPGENK